MPPAPGAWLFVLDLPNAQGIAQRDRTGASGYYVPEATSMTMRCARGIVEGFHFDRTCQYCRQYQPARMAFIGAGKQAPSSRGNVLVQ